PNEQKAALLRDLADRVTIDSGATRLSWKKPHSFLMRPALLDLARKSIQSGGRGRVLSRPVVLPR
ncbi:MAG: hypothetical protein K1X75_03265, partial [Leptospirales bacterium]|nr:hypothetical protein [Leptospirales bacterium]